MVYRIYLYGFGVSKLKRGCRRGSSLIRGPRQVPLSTQLTVGVVFAHMPMSLDTARRHLWVLGEFLKALDFRARCIERPSYSAVRILVVDQPYQKQ